MDSFGEIEIFLSTLDLSVPTSRMETAPKLYDAESGGGGSILIDMERYESSQATSFCVIA
ncbi:hypothetical protein P691DRAFT_802114 [Macrolepiota fuliginosa MF-IS2]|uniref:Pheromone n=1 Tax=Macrolepiota fuliginosa MF-IS2 TaxID=1400762 RepID=A0A9P5XBG9_9AGAR|nr:hypothetical protein P691DRAFT_802114 [Macrolepiota fuliginosa MF-IS2]